MKLRLENGTQPTTVDVHGRIGGELASALGVVYGHDGGWLASVRELSSCATWTNPYGPWRDDS